MSTNPRDQFRALANAETRPWFRVENKANDVARVDIYDFIDPWGINAQDFVKELNEIKAKTIDLHINSPGGDVFDAVTIYHALVDHPATVNVTIDGIAASAASFIAMSGDSVVMNTYAEAMIHEASAFAWGNADDLKETADFLNRQSEKIANIYADRAGGTVSDWRAAMKAETWYSAQEAVDAGLADSVKPAKKKDGDKADDEKKKDVENRFDLSAYNYQGRSHAPAPQRINAKREILNSITTESNSVDSNATEVSTVTPEQLQELGLSEGASEEEIAAAQEAKKQQDASTETTTTDEPTEVEKTETSTTSTTETETGGQASNSLQLPKGLSAVDTAAFNAMQARLADLEAKDAKNEREKHEAARKVAVENAIQAGKVAPSARATYEEMFDLNPAGTQKILNELPATFPTKEIGHSESPENAATDDSYNDAHLTPAERKAIAEARAEKEA